MKAMTYTGPDGSVVPRPDEELLERIIRQERGRYWRVGSGGSGLAVIELKGKDKRTRQAIDGEPALAFFLVEPHGFFFTFFEPGKFVEQLVPFAGGTSRPWVEHVVCGLEMYVPRACFVPRNTAWEIIQEFTRTKQRSRAVTWVNRSTLDFPSPEERRLSKADLA
ncbi:MAG TPA: hypothetical protein VLI90_17795 [Tepidisphaeraceae bacterium]|nr:hypothetical protein [Tepidisphaeraceae bacterium]